MKLISSLGFVPKEVRTLFVIKIFTTFSFSVLYSSLILYMTHDLDVSSQDAVGIVGVFISLNFLLHFFGGFAGGKIISNRGLLIFGMVMEFIGLLTLSSYLYLGLGIFLTGSGLYATSINAIMIQCYEPDDSRLELASFWIYSGMNLGFLIGNTVSGYFHLHEGYPLLFDISASISFLTLCLIGASWDNFADKSTELTKISFKWQNKRLLYALISAPLLIFSVISALYYHSSTANLVMTIGLIIFCATLFLARREANEQERKKVFAFAILVVAALIFWSLFFIGPMGLTLFIKQHVNRTFMGIEIPPQWLNNINTLIIVIGGPMLAIGLKNKREQGADLSVPFLFALALLCIGSAYAILPMSIYFNAGNEVVPLGWVVLSYILLTLGELLLSPVGVAMVGKLAPKGKQGVLLGCWSMVAGVASMLSKYLSQMMVLPTSISAPGIYAYSHMFNIVGWCAVFSGISLFTIVPFINRLISSEAEKKVLKYMNST